MAWNKMEKCQSERASSTVTYREGLSGRKDAARKSFAVYSDSLICRPSLGRQSCKLAKAMGVGFLVASTSSENKRSYLESLGCNKVIQSHQMRSQFAELEEVGFDIIVDPVGGSVRRESMDLLKRRGKLLVVGSADDTEDVQLSSNNLWLGNKEVISVNVGAMCAQDPERFVAAAKSVMDMIAKGQITVGPVEVFPFNMVTEAHRQLDNKNVQGKIVLRI
jgi:NADPH2:quinone reductase